jgi:sporulation protein YlmC with PRC-barrel domain
MKILFFITCGVLAVATVATAQDSPSQEGQKVRLISELIKDEGSKVQVKDLVLDLETGHAALQIVSWRHTDSAKAASKPVVAVAPYSPIMDIERATKLAKELSSAEPPTLNRKLAADLHSTFGQDVYWSKYISGLQPKTDSTFDKEEYELVPFATLKNKKIVDIDGESLGTLVDVALRESGDIAYCVLKSPDGALRAIPLGAFMDRERNRDWKIDLKREQILQFRPFEPQRTPQDIELGWKEYVSVRYGRDTLQEESKPDNSSSKAPK